MQFENVVDILCECRLFELSDRVADLAKSWVDHNLSRFGFLFPEESSRIVVPLEVDKEAKSILDKINSKGLKIDYDMGVVKGSKGREYRIGKYILSKGNGFTEEEKEWFKHQGQALESMQQAEMGDEYSVVISRNPIDIVRMSDHGRGLSS